MNSAATVTMIKLFETLPENLQERVLEHMREYINDMEDERKWNLSFSKTQNSLAAAAQQARKEISEGKSKPMDIKQL
ncbi:conserved hypothetical protein [Desulfamplus magnetovallimortis]|uniref:Uncharacterized protein n=1 Tax=Desulfamplus magnetovallimortis TaxID=1246637 RepID=A0A1W1H8N1_9BACT|nr:hypothetical protein [Desulfamplus magnetovallimortis]SLM28796.1 conserved hypothetical protein [Desulfamplus magnetovallimortis]